VLIVSLPAQTSRIALYEALAPHITRWGRRVGDESALIDLSNHPAQPAQTVDADGAVRDFDDLANGVADSLVTPKILVVTGLEQMLQDTPHRLAAFIEARARRSIVVVLSPQAAGVAALTVKATPMYVDRSDGAALADRATLIAELAVHAARLAFKRDANDPRAALRGTSARGV
jgi:hypothetical protein